MKKLAVFISILVLSCACSRKACMLPMYIDDYTFTTEERYFTLNEPISGVVISHQIAYPCVNDSIISNSTSIIKLDSGDTITVYTPCFTEDLDTGDSVMISNSSYNKNFMRTKREILRQFPKKSDLIFYLFSFCISLSNACIYCSLIPKLFNLNSI